MTVVEYTELTAAEIVSLVESNPLHVDAQCWLVTDEVIDLTDDLVADGSSVRYNIADSITRTCQVTLSRELQWSSARIQLFALLSDDGSDWVRFPLGVFLTSTPEQTINGASVPVWQVQGYDLTQILHTPIGASITIDYGDTIIPTIEALLDAAGLTHRIDQASVASTAPTTVTWSLTDNVTTLTVVNEMLAMVGYRPLAATPDGLVESEPYRSPVDMPVVWSFDTSSDSTIVSEERRVIFDAFAVPNEIVGVNDSLEGAIPVDGGGLTTLTNTTDGPLSVAARGYTVREVVNGQYASQADLVTAVRSRMDEVKRLSSVFELTVGPCPVLDHYSVVNLKDGAVDTRAVVTNWELPLDGSDMRTTLRQV